MNKIYLLVFYFENEKFRKTIWKVHTEFIGTALIKRETENRCKSMGSYNNCYYGQNSHGFKYQKYNGDESFALESIQKMEASHKFQIYQMIKMPNIKV